MHLVPPASPALTHCASAAVAQVVALRQEVARLQLLLQVSEAKVAMWEECMQTFLHSVMLSPEMNDIYKDECTRILRTTLSGVEQIQAVRFVDCSFPSVPTEVCCPFASLVLNAHAADASAQGAWALPPF